MSTVQTERVLVVPTSLFHELGHFQGFSRDIERYLAPLLDSEHASYRPRGEMETDPSFKQLIPYVIFRHTDADGNVSVFRYTRGSGQGEQRLHAKVSIGVGGHISTLDQHQEGAHTYASGMQRELDEEVNIETTYEGNVVGLINDDETEVGKVHLGVVHIFDVAEPRVTSNEDDLLEAGFVPLDELRGLLDRMETWSSICFEALFGAKA